MTLSERFHEIRTGFERPFWVANISEIFERLSYYGAFASLALYLQEKLNFSTEQTGTLTGLFGGMVWFLAIFGGAVADRLGFRRALSIAYLILAAAYFLIGSIAASWLAPVRNAVPLGLFVGCILILPALGISMVKPCVVGTTARASKENVRSIGYSIYYTMVNIGGALGPLFAAWAHRHLGVENVYRVAALSVFAMFFVVIIFFREPRKVGDAPPPSIATVARNFCLVVGNYRLVLPVLLFALLLRIGLAIYPQYNVPWWIWCALLVLVLAGISRFMWFLVIFTGYWVVFWQQYISLPGYIHGYINSNANVENDSGDRRTDRDPPHRRGKFHDPQNPCISGRDSRHGDHGSLVGDPRTAPNDLGSGAFPVCAGPGRNHSVSALLRIHFTARASWTAGHLHGLRVPAHRNWLAHRWLVWRHAGAPLRRSHSSAGAHLVERDGGRAGHGGAALDL